MEAKDTVMSGEKIEEAMTVEVNHLPLQRHAVFDGLSRYKLVAKAQAEISFKAGIREVVEFVLAHKETGLFFKHGNVYIKPSEWQAKLKEWGL